MNDSITQLNAAIHMALSADTPPSRTSRLMQEGILKIARKVGEEAIEVALDAVEGRRERVIEESADLIYNLSVLWVHLNIAPQDIWREMDRRAALYGIAEKEPKSDRDQKERSTLSN